MGVRFACHGCAEPLNIKQELAGRRGVCPKCGIRFRIPQFDATKSTPLENENVMASRSAAKNANVHANTGTRAAVASPQVTRSPKSAVISGLALAHMNSAIDPLGDTSISTWYVRPPSGGQYGPATTEVLRQWIHEGRVSATALLWREGWSQWREAREILSGLAGETAPVVNHFPASPEAIISGQSIALAAQATDIAENPAQMVGNAEIGKQRRERSLKRILTIGALSVVSLTLIIALVAVVRSSS